MRIPEELENLNDDKLSWNDILVVDDDREINDMIKRFLEKKFPSARCTRPLTGSRPGRS